VTEAQDGIPRFDSWQGQGIFFSLPPRLALRSTQPNSRWVPGALNLGVKGLWHDAAHSPPCSAEVKNAWSYTFTPPYVFTAWFLIKRSIRHHGVYFV
jgi:hypothetical protein